MKLECLFLCLPASPHCGCTGAHTAMLVHRVQRDAWKPRSQVHKTMHANSALKLLTIEKDFLRRVTVLRNPAAYTVKAGSRTQAFGEKKQVPRKHSIVSWHGML